MSKPNAEIVCVTLTTVGGRPVWWIGLKHFSPEFVGRSLADCEDEEEFADMFAGSTCLETRPPVPAHAAVERARQIARERKLPLYRSTRFQRDGGDCHAFELVE